MSFPTMRPASKQPPVHAPNAALLIDFDNVTMGIHSDLQIELRRLMNSEIIRGKVAVQRAYADWRRYPQYIVPLSEASIDLIFAPAFGSNKKNATDIRLAIDALELVFTRPEIGTFILLSGDSDFSSLVIKLKEYGKYVIGVGIRESSSDLLIQNCDEYFSYNELAGLTRVGDEETERRDPWELVVDAILEMKKRNDVMRSDRLKQVMQEIDPSFDEKNVGKSRFSKFVDEARERGLIVATKLENGQYEVDLGASAPGGAKALPPVPGGIEDRQSRERAVEDEREPRSRGGRNRRGGRGRGHDASRPEAEGTGMPLNEAFDLLKRALSELGAVNGTPEGEDKVREHMTGLYGKADEILTHRPRFGRFLKQAQDAKIVNITKTPQGYEVGLRAGIEAPAAPVTPAAAPEAKAPAPEKRGRGRGRSRAEKPAETAAAPAAEAETTTDAETSASLARGGLLFRRGSKTGRSASPAALVGVVQLGEAEAAPAAAEKKPRARRPVRSGRKSTAARSKKKGPSSSE